MKPYSHTIIEIARELRQRQTQTEELLWQRLRRHQLDGLKFKRQHRIGRYVVDFYCAELNLIIELEGAIHERKEHQEYDLVRFEELSSRGYRIERIKNEEVLENIENVLKKIMSYAR